LKKEKNVREKETVFKRNVLDIALEENPQNRAPVFISDAMVASMTFSQRNT